MPTFNDARVRWVNEAKPNRQGEYVLYWVQGFRRLDRNHALDFALHQCQLLKKPLVIYEGLRLGYPWASVRHHRFILEGMLDNAAKAQEIGINYWPFVETPKQDGKGLLKKLAKKAVVIVTDDYPTFIIPGQTAALAKQVSVPLISVDSNTIIPLSLYGEPVSAAAHLRHRVHRLFAEAWKHRASVEPDFPKAVRMEIEPPFALWPTTNLPSEEALTEFLHSLPLDTSVPAVPGVHGGSKAGQEVLKQFVKNKLNQYAEGRNNPDDPKRNAASGLSVYMHYGHVSMQEIAEAVLNSEDDWTPEKITTSARGKREGFYHRNANINSFLDEAITWRDVGYHWHACRVKANPASISTFGMKVKDWEHPVYFDLASTLPEWAMKTLEKHATDPRPNLYELEEFEQGDTHDPLWNAAQRELVATGRIHNYLRMLWGKKVLEWSKTPEEAYRILEHLNNKYALDGRDPNSYTGILWCFGLFDRPWAPERKIFGTIRYMSSDNTAKKFKLEGYYRYINDLPTIRQITGEKTKQ